MKKQKYFYHASPARGLEVITPKSRTTPGNFGQGPVVFATHIFNFATNFLVKHDDSWANGGTFGGVFYFVIGDIERFRRLDNKGGVIYLVSSEGFEKFNQWEWYKKEEVKTLGEISFSSGFDAMIIHGVQVYVVEKDVYSEIQNSKDHGLAILNNTVSENEKMGYLSQKLDIYKSSKKRLY